MEKELLYELIKVGSQKLSFVKKLDFYAETSVKEDKFEILYKNDHLKRGVEFGFWPITPKGNYRFIIYLFRLPSITANDIFSLDRYFDNKRINIDCNYTTLEGYEGNIEERIDAYFKCIDYIFNTYLVDIINGKTWEVIPIDWGPYK